MLNGEGVSLGAYTSLYLLFTPSLRPGEIRVTDDGGEWWQRYTYVGVAPDFLDRPDASDIAIRETVSAIKAIRSDLVDVIDEADRIVSVHSHDIRFLIKTRETARFTVEVSFTVPVWPELSFLFLSLTEKESGEYREAPPMALDFYQSAFGLAGTIKVTRLDATLSPKGSLSAQLTSSWHGPFRQSLVEFVPRERPVMSKLIKPRG
jgi:hypothetical protein